MATGISTLNYEAKHEAKKFWPVLKETGSDWMEDNAMRLSAALALYTILSMAPLLVITVKVVSVVVHNADVQVRDQLKNLTGEDTANFIVQTFKNSTPHNSGIIATIVSTLVLLFSATGVFIELQDSMNTIWGVKPKPNQGVMNFIRNRLLSLAMVFGIGFLLLVSMFISTILTAAAKLVAGDASWLAYIIDLLVSLGVVALLFAAIFKFLPDVKLSWRHVWLGAVLTAALFTLGKYALALYFKKALPQSAFGVAGSLAAVLLWVYYSSFLLFFGAEFTKVWSLHHGHRIIPDASAVVVTEEERAQRGIPSQERMEKALAGKPLNQPIRARKSPARILREKIPLPVADYALAAGGLVVGAIAGGIGAHYLLGDDKKLSRKNAASLRLNERLQGVERRLANASSQVDRFLREREAQQQLKQIEKKLKKGTGRLQRFFGLA